MDSTYFLSLARFVAFVCCVICFVVGNMAFWTLFFFYKNLSKVPDWLYWPISIALGYAKKSKGYVNQNGDFFPSEKIEETTNNTVVDVIQNSNWKTFGEFPSEFANDFTAPMVETLVEVRAQNNINERTEEELTERLKDRLTTSKRKIQLDD